MAAARILLPIGAASLPDNTAGNACPALLRFQGTETNPKKHFPAIAFDAATQEFVWWTFRMPSNYGSGGVVKLQWMANATSGAVVWSAKLGAVTPGDADTPVEHAAAAASSVTDNANATEARRLVESSITLANLDSAAAGDLVTIGIFRDASNGSDTCTVDAELVSATFEYTTT